MLDVIRSNAQSLGIKIAFGLIIVVFVFWGVGSYTGGTVSDIIVVNDRPITIYELHTLAANMTRQLKERQPDLTDDQLKQYQVRLRAAQQLIMNVILEQEAQRVGIAVTPFELRREIESLPYFKNQDGAFDPALYKQILENNGTTPANFEKSITSELLQRKLFEHVTAGTAVSETEARSLFNFLAERRTMDYVLFPLADFAEQATPTAEAVRAAYDEGRDSAFKVPAKADVEYLLLSADTLAGAFAPDEAAVQAFYDANKERFTTSEQVRARHILLLAPAGAEPGSEAEKQTRLQNKKSRNCISGCWLARILQNWPKRILKTLLLRRTAVNLAGSVTARWCLNSTPRPLPSSPVKFPSRSRQVMGTISSSLKSARTPHPSPLKPYAKKFASSLAPSRPQASFRTSWIRCSWLSWVARIWQLQPKPGN